MMIQDVELEVEQRGNGFPLVFVHGSASDLRTWQTPFEEFAKDRRVVRYSRRHHWPNTPLVGRDGYSMRQHVDDLRALLRTLDAAPADLVGHSYGAYLCLRLAIEAPGCIRRLVLVEPPVFPLFVSDPPTPAELLRVLLTRPRTALTLVSFAARGLGPARRAADRGDLDTAIRVFGRAVLGPRAFAALSEQRWQQVRANNIRAEYLAADHLPLPAESLGRVEVPTLLVTGARSPRLFHRLTDRLEQLLPNSRRVTIAGASHIVHEDNPGDFTAAVRVFLTPPESPAT